jgi:hypothetical protein
VRGAVYQERTSSYGEDEDQGMTSAQGYVCSRGDLDGSVRLSEYEARPQVVPISRPIQVKVVM